MTLSKEQIQAKEAMENSLWVYAQAMFPNRYFGDVHRDFFNYFQKSLEDALESGDGDNAGALIPRDHQKSFCIAVAVSWVITKHPWFTIAYVSANPTLSERQLTVIKNIFKSEMHREFWPNMLRYEYNTRTKDYEHKPKGAWTKTEISVDHPDRPESEKDPTIWATSAKSTNTGAHFKLCVFDDLVTNENYKSSSEREEIRETYQSFSSIATTGSLMWAVGTRYGDNDLYATLKEKTYDVYNDDGEVVETRPLWKFFERVVEDSKLRDGSGNYIWPRQKMPNGNWYGFNATELSKKRSHAMNLELYFAQYYNDPNAVGTDRVSREHFQYANPKFLEQENGKWKYGEKVLSLHCGVDLAFSESTGIRKIKRDYTAISVIGWDTDGYLYVLEQRRFQTDKAEVYYQNLFELWEYWGFPKATIESNAGGKVIANFIQDEMRRQTANLIIEAKPSTRNKEERIEEILEPLYRNGSVFHFKGGLSRILEEELRLSRPSTDDLKDSLFIAVSTSKRNTKPRITTNKVNSGQVVKAQNRFLNRRRRA